MWERREKKLVRCRNEEVEKRDRKTGNTEKNNTEEEEREWKI